VKRLNRTVGAVRNGDRGNDVTVLVERCREAGVAAVLVHENERLDCHRTVEFVDLDAAANAVVRVVHEGIAVLIDDVLGDDGEVADIHFKVRVTGVRTARVVDE
jgi:hypothetical protein